jgi:tripartite-type tricarboxylate transporter receptor subunit TctC
MTHRQLIGPGGIAAAAALLTLACTGAAPRAQAQDYPSRPITLVVGLPPGGPTDSVARILAERMKVTLGQSLVVENQAGAAGTIAAARVARAPPDGYTLSVGQWSTNVGAAAVFPLQFDVLGRFPLRADR